MKTTPSTEARRKPAGTLPLEGASAPSSRAGAPPTSVVFRTVKDARRQHTAIAKLVKMCQASPVVAHASRGITAEVRRDRDRGND